MITDSETFRPVTVNLDTTSSFTDPVLLRETANARLYRMSKAGKHFIIKTTKDNSAMQLSILKREYEMSISFNHYHIAHHYTYETQTPIGPGIVMEYIDGRNLGEYLAENPSSDSRRRVFYQILDAVAYIHKCGIIHNDLKPENILISRANNDVKLIDFGLSDNDAHYLAKTLGCTPTYASPELLSHGSAIDARSDIYSLGRIMQLIFGRKYHKMSQKCINSDPNRRYDNVDQLRRQWLKTQQPPYTAIIILLIILIPATFLLGRITSPSAIGSSLQDSLNIARNEAKATQTQLDSIVSANNATLAIENRRQATIDSVCNTYGNALAQLYRQAEPKIKNQRFYEFANSIALKDLYSKMWDMQKLIYNVQYETAQMQSEIITRVSNISTEYYDKTTALLQQMPQIGTLADEQEKNFYYQLLENDQPYRPYQP